MTKTTDAEIERRLAAIDYAEGSVAHLAPGRNLADELIADRRAAVALVEGRRERVERLRADRVSFPIDPKAWQEIVAVMDQPAKARPGLSKLFSRPRPE